MGPNDTGIILGGADRGKELIEAIRMQSFPNYGIGRPFKVSKEQIVGLIRALEIFVSRDEDLLYQEQMEKAEHIVKQIEDIPHLTVRIIPNDDKDYEHPISAHVPKVYMEWDQEKIGFDAQGLDEAIAEDDPPISLRPPRLTQSYTTTSRSIRLIDTYFLRDGEEKIVSERLKKVFTRRG